MADRSKRLSERVSVRRTDDLLPSLERTNVRRTDDLMPSPERVNVRRTDDLIPSPERLDKVAQSRLETEHEGPWKDSIAFVLVHEARKGDGVWLGQALRGS